MTASESQKIVDALVAAGWQKVGHRTGVYVRLAHPHDDGSLIVPFDQTAPEYRQMMDAVAARLVWYQELGDAARHALNTMHREGVAP